MPPPCDGLVDRSSICIKWSLAFGDFSQITAPLVGWELQAAWPIATCCFITMSISSENRITRQLYTSTPSHTTYRLFKKAAASKEEGKKIKIKKKFISRSSRWKKKKKKKKSLHYKQLIYRDAATDRTLYVALCISVDTWMEK